jgi:hypothetical protein
MREYFLPILLHSMRYLLLYQSISEHDEEYEDYFMTTSTMQTTSFKPGHILIANMAITVRGYL